MKIIKLEEFRKLKPGTIFSKYAPCSFSGLMCKYETTEYDFIYSDIINDIDNDSTGDFVDKCTSMENGESQRLEVEGTTRDGMYEKEQLFAIYEKDDIEQLINKLFKSIEQAHGSNRDIMEQEILINKTTEIRTVTEVRISVFSGCVEFDKLQSAYLSGEPVKITTDVISKMFFVVGLDTYIFDKKIKTDFRLRSYN